MTGTTQIGSICVSRSGGSGDVGPHLQRRLRPDRAAADLGLGAAAVARQRCLRAARPGTRYQRHLERLRRPVDRGVHRAGQSGPLGHQLPDIPAPCPGPCHEPDRSPPPLTGPAGAAPFDPAWYLVLAGPGPTPASASCCAGRLLPAQGGPAGLPASRAGRVWAGGDAGSPAVREPRRERDQQPAVLGSAGVHPCQADGRGQVAGTLSWKTSSVKAMARTLSDRVSRRYAGQVIAPAGGRRLAGIVTMGLRTPCCATADLAAW